jgi:hypothetical protein
MTKQNRTGTRFVVDGRLAFAGSEDRSDPGIKCPARPVGRGGNNADFIISYNLLF